MNGRTAKRLRIQAYGDRPSCASSRKKRMMDGVIKCTDDRTTYQDLKKDYYRKEKS